MAKKVDPFVGATDDKATVYKQVAIVNRHTNEGRRMLAVAAASCVLYATATEDVQPAIDLANGIGHGGDVLVKWFTTFGPFRYGKNEKGEDSLLIGKRSIDAFRKRLTEDKAAWGTELVTNPFFVWQKPKSPFKPANLEQLIGLAISRVEKQLASDDLSDEDKAKVNATGLDEAKAALNRIKIMNINAKLATPHEGSGLVN